MARVIVDIDSFTPFHLVDLHYNLVCLDRPGGDMSHHWQLQEAKQRFSELIRFVEVDGPQFVTRHGKEVAVVIDIAEYRRLKGDRTEDFKDFLLAAPPLEELEIDRPSEPARGVDLGDGA
ncbi:type II toxin-antitoxin system Phd/YefM family antitoxin [Kutzneria sp. 744]|uniref:type II toxin-antitoxin system Phd/YefM family antitoxin n=1 Tax=Kutzneria sp. (strain 744) TaxID=345341 RepID=UPI0003EEADAB|nr:type II toxin-antitoxin system Phd/YefM family antitoxin [Kutzneria sp. 744]EWM16358.1 prevent-host-death family protein [Kutzneria sp. 744]